jgi:tetratricopeptide (TPR) repeat protein
LQEVGLAQVCEEIDAAFKKDDYARVDALLWPALDQFNDMPQLWFYAGNLNFNLGRVALSEQCFQRCTDLDSNPLVLANLAAAKRRLNKHDEGIAVCEFALDRQPDYEPTLVNFGSMFVNEGCPERGIPPLERACEIGKEKGRYERGAQWNLGLLYLEAGRFAEGFDIYRTGLGAERLERKYGSEKHGIPEPAVLQPTDSGVGKTLIVWGEQGIGDELMAGTILKDAIAEFDEVIFECHPRLEWLHRNAHPGLRIYPTRKDDYIGWPITDQIKADYKCPILDLAARYRRGLESFTNAWGTHGPTYSAPEDEVHRYRQQLKAIAGDRPVVGLATHGGVMQTARQYRTMRTPDVEKLFANTDCVFVGLDYDDMTGFTLWAHERFGADRYQWFPSIVQHWEYEHVAALVAACDMTVTVCQSVFHLSAAMGKPTRCLVPKRCAWRYAPVEGQPELSYWYPDPAVKLYRSDDTWAGPIQKVIEDIRSIL